MVPNHVIELLYDRGPPRSSQPPPLPPQTSIEGETSKYSRPGFQHVLDLMDEEGNAQMHRLLGEHNPNYVMATSCAVLEVVVSTCCGQNIGYPALVEVLVSPCAVNEAVVPFTAKEVPTLLQELATSNKGNKHIAPILSQLATELSKEPMGLASKIFQPKTTANGTPKCARRGCRNPVVTDKHISWCDNCAKQFESPSLPL